MKLYLDNSFLNRPFDDFSIKQNQVEAEVLEWIIEWVKDGKVQLVNSEMIQHENSLNPFPERKEYIASISCNESGFSFRLKGTQTRTETEQQPNQMVPIVTRVPFAPKRGHLSRFRSIFPFSVWRKS